MKYFEAYRDYLKRYWRYTQENMYWREAQYELAKAQLAKKNNIAPKGVDYDDFPKQERRRASKRAQSREAEARSREAARRVGARETG